MPRIYITIELMIEQIFVGAKSCSFDHNTEYNGEWIGNPLKKSDPMACYNTCKQKSECKFFVFRNGNECILLKTKTNENPNKGVTSGKREDTCPEKSESGKLFSFLKRNLL